MKKFSVSVEKLNVLLSFLAMAVRDNPAYELLTHVAFAFSKGLLFAKATDLQLTIIGSTEVVEHDESLEGVNFTLPFKKLREFLGTLPKEESITIHIDERPDKRNHRIVWNYLGSSGHKNLQGFEALDFPQRAKIPKDTEVITLLEDEALLFVDALKQVSYVCASDKAWNPLFTGVNVAYRGGIPTIIETAAYDGFQIAMSHIYPEYDPRNKFSVTVPRNFPEAVKRAVELSSDCPLMITVCENQLVINVGTCVIATTLIAGRFPDYWLGIPQTDSFFAIDKELLLLSLDRVNATSHPHTKTILILISSQGHGKVSLYSQCIESDVYTNETVTVSPSSKLSDIRLALDGSSFRKAVAASVGDTITVRYNAGFVGVFIESNGSETTNLFKGVVTSDTGEYSDLIGLKKKA